MTLSRFWWRWWAACRTHPNPDLWYPEKGDHTSKDEAIRICNTCPVKGPCRLHALRADEQEGIWGGLTPNQRTRILGVPVRYRRAPRTTVAPTIKPLQPCGTNAAYLRHVRDGETACTPCLDAHNAYGRNHRQQTVGVS